MVVLRGVRRCQLLVPAGSEQIAKCYAWWAPRRFAVWASKLLFSVFPSRELALMMAEPWAHGPERKDKQGAEPDGDVAGSGRRHPVFGIVGQEIFFCKLTSFL